MEPEIVSEDWDWEVRRVAAVFGAKDKPKMSIGGPFVSADACFGPNEDYLEWKFIRPIGSVLIPYWIYLKVAQKSDDGVNWADKDDWPSYSQINYFQSRGVWYREAFGEFQDKMSHSLVRGLYCLGFEDSVINIVNYPLTSHEKLELRLSLPREFWPQKWLDEETE